MQEVEAETWHEDILVDFFKGVATGAKCVKCGHKVWVIGSDDRAAQGCTEKLTAECPIGERNRYSRAKLAAPMSEEV